MKCNGESLIILELVESTKEVYTLEKSCKVLYDHCQF